MQDYQWEKFKLLSCKLYLYNDWFTYSIKGDESPWQCIFSQQLLKVK